MPWRLASKDCEIITGVCGVEPAMGYRGRATGEGMEGDEAECRLYFVCPKEDANLRPFLIFGKVIKSHNELNNPKMSKIYPQI